MCTGPEHGLDLAQELRAVSGRMRMVEVTFAKWWRMWYDQVWESLLPLKKWKEAKKNLAPGDLVMLKYSNKYSSPQYRYAVVLKAHPDAHGLVRDVTIGLHSRRRKEAKGVYTGSLLEEQLVAVQRCTLLLAKEDQSTLEPADPNLHICEDELRFPNLEQAVTAPSPNGPNVPETPRSPGPTESHQESELDVTQPLPDPNQTRLHMFGVRSLNHLTAQKSEVTCWQCVARQEIKKCEDTVIPQEWEGIWNKINN